MQLQIMRGIIQSQQAMKRSLQLKENKSHNKMKISDSGSYITKDLKVYLPPIKFTTEQEAQKTLTTMVRSMQSFVASYPGDISIILVQCLTSLYEHLPESNQHSESLYLSQASAPNKKGAKDSLISQKTQDGGWGSKSQMFSIKRNDLKKVESRKLFEKMRSAKYDEVALKNDKEIIAALKNRIAEKEQELCQLNKKIEELKLKSEVQQSLLTQQQERFGLIEETNKSLNITNNQLLAKIQSLSTQNMEIQAKSSSLTESLTKKCEQIQLALRQREQQLTSLWQTVLSNGHVCLL